MVNILGHEVLLFEKPRLCKRGTLIAVVYFLLFIIQECVVCLELSCPNKWMELPSNCSHFVRNQCLVRRHFSEAICKLSINRNTNLRTIELRKNMLNFCNHYNLAKVMSESDILTHIEGRNCLEFLRNIQCKDSLAETMYNQFVDLLSRLDCQKPYSVQWNCTDCLHSYKMWTCSRHFSIYQGDTKYLPCYDVCTNVEKRCPFFRPDPESSRVHAGEPSFLCKALTDVRNNSLSNEHCYKACYFTDSNCPLPPVDRGEITSNTNSSLPSNCSSIHICYLWTNVIGLFCLWLVRTFIQYMSIGLT